MGGSPSPSQLHVAYAVVLPADVAGPGTSARKAFPCALMPYDVPFTKSCTLLTSFAATPKPDRIHRVVPPSQGRFVDPFPVQGVVSTLASAVVEKNRTWATTSTKEAITPRKPKRVMAFAVLLVVRFVPDIDFRPPDWRALRRTVGGLASSPRCGVYGLQRLRPSVEGPSTRLGPSTYWRSGRRMATRGDPTRPRWRRSGSSVRDAVIQGGTMYLRNGAGLGQKCGTAFEQLDITSILGTSPSTRWAAVDA